ncbi:MAG: MFS transporter [Chloroflexota bacterium]|nr:MFS transporter [Chloroflexota bacterium]MDE2885867.1 MFS transporter [Chloroflexota bacterium]
MKRARPIIPVEMVYAVSPTGVVIMGDSLMYVVLPVAALEFGVDGQLGLATSFWIGLALSINRFVRLVSNAFAASVYQRFGVRWPFVASIAAGALSTLAYGLGSGVAVLLLARAVWGVAYSHMRLAAQLTAFGVGTSAIRGRMMGLFNSGQRFGSFVAVTAGAVLFHLTSREVTFTALAVIGLLGVLIATRVPNLRPERLRPSAGGFGNRLNVWDIAISRLPGYGRKLRAPLLSISLMRFATAFGANGLAIATMAPYIARFGDANDRVLNGAFAVVTLAGLLVGFRWLSDISLGVLMGYLSDRVGRRMSIACGMAAMVASLAMMVASDSVIAVIIGMPLLFVAAVGVNTALDAAIGETATGPTRAAVMGRYATWLDLGAALGPFAGFLIAERIGFGGAFLIAAALLAVTWAFYVAATGNPRRRQRPRQQ